jgi:hypothetical protein
MVFRTAVSTVVFEAVNLDEPGWVELERVVQATLGARLDCRLTPAAGTTSAGYARPRTGHDRTVSTGRLGT